MAPWEWRLPVGRKVTRLVHREAITHSLLDHPNILPFLGVYHEEIDSPPVTTLPLIERGSLQQLLSGPLLVGITQGVVYLHSLRPPIVHGDLHPGNVLIGDDDTPYLCDFGLSHIRHEVTRTRTIIREGGMRRFMAPELSSVSMERFRATTATDIFSLAMTCLNAWSAQLPFSEGRRLPQKRATPHDTHYPRRIKPKRKIATLGFAKKNMWSQVPAGRPSSADVEGSLMHVFPSGELTTPHELSRETPSSFACRHLTDQISSAHRTLPPLLQSSFSTRHQGWYFDLRDEHL
ncbi:kinase-like protein [Clavulina sp. PMI_390]|nr:kinase-like protein [Clavulina sp. PMI_390]